MIYFSNSFKEKNSAFRHKSLNSFVYFDSGLDLFQYLIFAYYLLGPAAFRPRAHLVTTYTPSIDNGRPVLQGLLAIDFLTKEASFINVAL